MVGDWTGDIIRERKVINSAIHTISRRRVDVFLPLLTPHPSVTALLGLAKERGKIRAAGGALRAIHGTPPCLVVNVFRRVVEDLACR